MTTSEIRTCTKNQVLDDSMFVDSDQEFNDTILAIDDTILSIR